jgi:hypothetical protein
MIKPNKKLDKRLKTIEKQVKRLTKLLSNTVGTDFNAPQKKKMKQEKKQQKKASLRKIESQVKALAAVISQLASQEKIDKTSQIPKEKEEEEEEPVITFSTYKFTFYVKPKKGGKTYQSVKKLPDPDDASVVVYAVKDKRLILKDSALKGVPPICYTGTAPFEHLTECLIKQSKDDTDQTEKIETILNNLGSVLVAIETTREGDSTPTKVEEGYEAKLTLAGDVAISAIHHRFLQNNNLLESSRHQSWAK